MASTIQLKEIELPDFGMDEKLVAVSSDELEGRIRAVLHRMRKKKLDFLLVFADREHYANLTYLTNLDPRFEESLLLIRKDGERKMLLGNECMGYTGICPIPVQHELYQEFSLMGQDRSQSRELEVIFKDFGIRRGSRVGCSYYKYFTDPNKLDMPAYIADVLRKISKGFNNITNASDIFMHCETGLRNRNSLEELVRFEWASTRTSESMKNLLKQVKPGAREYDLARNYVSDGLPYSCHPMVSSGEKARIGLSSPSAGRVVLKDPFTAAFGIWGALTCRAGMVAKGPEQLDKNVAVFFERFWKGFFQTVCVWYESLGIGEQAGTITRKVEAAREKDFFTFCVNTGHTLHLDEWVNSPFTLTSKVKLYSGMALQMDIIPVSKGGFVCANMEDGVALADEKLRNEWAEKYPSSWKRIQARRNFMREEIGIKLKAEVLPLSNIPAYYAPYLLSPARVAACT